MLASLAFVNRSHSRRRLSFGRNEPERNHLRSLDGICHRAVILTFSQTQAGRGMDGRAEMEMNRRNRSEADPDRCMMSNVTGNQNGLSIHGTLGWSQRPNSERTTVSTETIRNLRMKYRMVYVLHGLITPNRILQTAVTGPGPQSVLAL